MAPQEIHPAVAHPEIIPETLSPAEVIQPLDALQISGEVPPENPQEQAHTSASVAGE